MRRLLAVLLSLFASPAFAHYEVRYIADLDHVALFHSGPVAGGITLLRQPPPFAAQIQAAMGFLPWYATAALPTSCTNGQLVWDTTASTVKVCNGNAWSAVGGGASLSGNNTFTGTNIFQDGAKFQIQNQADSTKVLEFDLSTMTTATTATYQFGPAGQMHNPSLGTAAQTSYGWTGVVNGGMHYSGGVLLATSGVDQLGISTSNGCDVCAVQQGSAATLAFGSSAGSSLAAGMYFPTVGTFGLATTGALIVKGDGNQHLTYPPPVAAPTVTAGCGGTPTVTGSDSAFQLNVGTGGASATCTVTFNKAFGFKPVCVVSDETSQAITTTAVPASASVVFTATANWTASSILDVMCFGNQ